MPGGIRFNLPRNSGSVNVVPNRITADVSLSLSNIRSTQIFAITEGKAQKTDIDIIVDIFRDGNPSVNIGRYATTDIGRVISQAFLNAYTLMVQRFSSLPQNAPANSNLQAVRVTKPASLLSDPLGTKIVRLLDTDSLLIPTGQKQGLFWEVTDEYGYSGWLSVENFQWAR